MSYKVLARKWRPQHFRDMIGQEPVLRALVNALDSDRLHHAYLFTGMRGVGKTTIARIFAKCLNCVTRGVGSSPCGECSACRDIEAGRFLDLIEVDAASRTKVDETRELLENVPYAPASGRYKVYLIDEVHMFSTHSFNALLKTLEEPPEHVKFLLATTDPQKVPLTVLSRCLQFNLRRMPGGALADYLATLLDAEDIGHDRAALELVARAAEGSVRDALSLVEQAAALGDGHVLEAGVESMLGRVSPERLLGLLAALGERDLDVLFERVDALAEYAPDFGELLGELLSLLHRVALAQSVPGSVRAEAPGGERLGALAAELSPETVQLWYQIGLHARRDLPFAPDPREAFDMALLRMCSFAPQQGVSATSLGVPAAASAPGEPAPDATSTAPVPVPSARAVSAPAGADAAGPAPASAPLAAPSPPADGAGSGREAALAAALGQAPAPSPVAPPATPPVAASSASSPEPPPEPGPGSLDAPPGSPSAPARAEPVPSPEPAVPPPGNTAAAPAALAAVPSGERLDTGQGGPADASGAALTPDGWPRLVEAMRLSGMPKQLAAHTAFAGRDGDTVTLALEAGCEHMNSPRFAERLRVALVAWAGREIALDIRLVEAAADAPLETPARLVERRQADEMEEARRAIDEDPLVQALVAGVDGALDPNSVRPRPGAADEQN